MGNILLSKVNVTINDVQHDVPMLQLMQWRSALRLEILGMRHSSGRSVSGHVKKLFGLKNNLPKQDILDILVDVVNQAKEPYSDISG
jgi:hypothetical protein